MANKSTSETDSILQRCKAVLASRRTTREDSLTLLAEQAAPDENDERQAVHPIPLEEDVTGQDEHSSVEIQSAWGCTDDAIQGTRLEEEESRDQVGNEAQAVFVNKAAEDENGHLLVNRLQRVSISSD